MSLPITLIYSAHATRFSTVFPMELESRIAPAAFQSFVESINSPLEEAYSVSGAITDNLIAVLTWWTSLLWRTSHFEKVRGVHPLIKSRHLTVAGTAARRADHSRGE